MVEQARRHQTTQLEEACGQTVPQAPTREFQRRTGDRRVKKYFPMRLPPKYRSERDAHVAVLINRNGGCQKILLE